MPDWRVKWSSTAMDWSGMRDEKRFEGSPGDAGGWTTTGRISSLLSAEERTRRRNHGQAQDANTFLSTLALMAASAPTYRLPLPLTALRSVEFPGPVGPLPSSQLKALTRLGTLPVLLSILHQPSTAAVPELDLSGGKGGGRGKIKGETQPVQNVLMRVVKRTRTRETRDHDGTVHPIGSGVYTLEPIGLIDQTVRFRGQSLTIDSTRPVVLTRYQRWRTSSSWYKSQSRIQCSVSRNRSKRWMVSPLIPLIRYFFELTKDGTAEAIIKFRFEEPNEVFDEVKLIPPPVFSRIDAPQIYESVPSLAPRLC